MAKISPFQALRYDTKKVKLAKVVCPPYDVINRQQRKCYIKNSPYNIVRITLPERHDGDRDYKKAKRDLDSWIKKGILKQDKAPALYIYLQEYKIGKRPACRLGFFSLLELDDRNKRGVLPHERVFSKPLKDRFLLIRQTRTHPEPIFLICRDKDFSVSQLLSGKVRKTRPEVDIAFEGVRHKLWPVTDRHFIEVLQKAVERTRVFIADGHHRFEASLAVKGYFASHNRKADTDGYRHTLAYLVSSKDKGLLILPTYRAVKILPKGFNSNHMLKRLNRYFKTMPISAKEIHKALQGAAEKDKSAFVIFYKNRYFYLELKDKAVIKRIDPQKGSCQWRNLDVSILHNLIFAKLLCIKEKIGSQRNIYYYKGSQELVRRVKSGEHKLGVFLNPSTMGEVERIAEAGEKMPHKSTYFYPKPLTGLLIHKF